MLKKLLIVFFQVILLLILTSCKYKEENIVINPIDINFEVGTIDNGIITFNYPLEDWTEISDFHSDDITSLLIAKNEKLNVETNINIIKGENYEKSNLKDYINYKISLIEESFNGMKVNVSEIRKINDIQFGYMEITTKFTNEMIDKVLKEGLFTKKDIEDMGGKEYLLSIPEAKQIQISIYLGGKFNNITALYIEDSEKEIVTKAIQTIVQTAKLK